MKKSYTSMYSISSKKKEKKKEKKEEEESMYSKVSLKKKKVCTQN